MPQHTSVAVAGFLEGSSLPLLLPPRLILGEFQEFPRVLQVHLPASGLPRCLGDIPRGSIQPPDEFRQRNHEKAVGRAGSGLQTDNLNKVDHLLSDRRAASLASPPPFAAAVWTAKPGGCGERERSPE